MVFSCLLAPPWAAGRGAQNLPRTGPFAIEVVLKKLDKIRRPSKTGIRSAILCHKSPWCLPGAFQSVQMAFSCLPGASLVPCRLSN